MPDHVPDLAAVGASAGQGQPPWALVYDTNADALVRRVAATRAAATGHEVLGFTSVTALLLHARCAPAGSAALIDLYDTDRYAIDRPGERIISRLARAPRELRLIAWTAHVSPDVLAGAREAGAHAVVISGLDVALEREALASTINDGGRGALHHPGASAGEPGSPSWSAWFLTRYGLRWADWMEPALVRLATTGERAAHALELWDLGAASSQERGVARLRDLAQALGGERYRNTALVAREANLVLALIAAERPLSERPKEAASLSHAVAALRREPSLAIAAHLTGVEASDLQEQWAAIESARVAETAMVGARPAGWAEAERLHAAGRRAVQLGASVDDVDAVAAGVIARTEQALLAVAEAQRDALYVPEARAAAALLAMGSKGPSVPIADVEFTGDDLRWQGHSPLELARSTGHDPAELRALTDALDRDLVRRI